MEIIPTNSGASLMFIKNDLFKASLLTVRFILPINSDEITENAMAADIISECCKAYPTPERLQLKLSALYGADISCSNEKSGDAQIITLSLKCLADRYGIGGEECFKKATDILKQLIFNPDIKEAGFSTEAVERARRRQIDTINSEINDKRIYAKNRMEENMFSGEAYGVPRYGYVEKAKSATPESLKNAYLRLVNGAAVRIAFVGEALPPYVEELASAFEKGERFTPVAYCYKPPAEIKTVTEKMEVTQGKLVMGFRTPEIGGDRETAALAVAVDIFGGGPYSKLFSEVREKQSLCYYCSARAIRKMGYVSVESGVEDINAERAKKEILSQLSLVQKGEFSDEVIDFSKRSICDSLNSVQDSIASIDYWYGLRFLESDPLGPKEFSNLIASVTREEIVESAKKIQPDTFYFLQGERSKS